MKAFDLDGVLAEGPPAADKKWSFMKGPERKLRQAFLLDHYANAKPLMKIEEKCFHVITARKADPDVMRVTENWFMNKMFHVQHSHRQVDVFTKQLMGEDLPRLQIESAINSVASVPSLQTGASTETSENASVESRTTQKDARALLCEVLCKAGENKEAALSDLQQSSFSNASSELRFPIESSLVMPTLPFVPTQEGAFAVHFFNGSRSIKNVGAFKAKVLQEIGATEFYEDNKEILKEIRSYLPDIQLFWVYQDQGEMKWKKF